MPEGHSADALRATARNRFNVSLGGGLGPLNGTVFRIGHLGDLNEPMLLGALGAVEMSLRAQRRAARPGRRRRGDGLSDGDRGVGLIAPVPPAAPPIRRKWRFPGLEAASPTAHFCLSRRPRRLAGGAKIRIVT